MGSDGGRSGGVVEGRVGAEATEGELLSGEILQGPVRQVVPATIVVAPEDPLRLKPLFLPGRLQLRIDLPSGA